jgi:hypothetical protein
MLALPKQIKLPRQKQYRIIPSSYPPINFFEHLVDPADMDILWEIESLTNERLRQEAGELFLVPPEDRICGPGSTVVMAAFTHINHSHPTRFSDGSYGIYYASFAVETAIQETIFRREQFLSATNEKPCEVTMRVYEGKINKPLHDIRPRAYQAFQHPSHYAKAQQFGKTIRATKSWGLVYPSVRHVGGTCVAAFRPHAVSIPRVVSHLRYVWDGNNIVDVLCVKKVDF